MKQNYKIYLAALLLVGAVSMMTARAQGSGKPTLAVFVVGMASNTDGDNLATQIAVELNRNSRYTVLSSTSNALANKLAELRAAHIAGKSIDRNELATWGRDNGISTICLVTDAIKGNDHMFYAHLIDAKESKVAGRGRYIRTGVTTTDLPRVSLALSRQLDGPGRRLSAPAPVRSYPAELDIEMVRVEGGTFKIGCNGTTDAPCYTGNDREIPQRTITLSSFSIGKYEVTRAQWIAVMKDHPTLSNPGTWKDDDQLPIELVSWNDVQEFLTRLNELTGRTTEGTKYRLPTNAEWEYAARGCKAGACDNYKFSGSDVIDDVAWYSLNSSSRIHPVGQKKPNGLGIYDMSGSLFVWCSDWYDYNYYKNTLKDGDVDPKGPASGSMRVMRGGCMLDDALLYNRVASRNGKDPSVRVNHIGFRVVVP
jgi:formylglycine-generating enzyme required for sulfatase activity